MARNSDLAGRKFRQVRRAMNRRLAKAEREGRFREVMAHIERRGKGLYAEIVNGATGPARRKQA